MKEEVRLLPGTVSTYFFGQEEVKVNMIELHFRYTQTKQSSSRFFKGLQQSTV